jgi:hypothetical protein
VFSLQLSQPRPQQDSQRRSWRIGSGVHFAPPRPMESIAHVVFLAFSNSALVDPVPAESRTPQQSDLAGILWPVTSAKPFVFNTGRHSKNLSRTACFSAAGEATACSIRRSRRRSFSGRTLRRGFDSQTRAPHGNSCLVDGRNCTYLRATSF